MTNQIQNWEHANEALHQMCLIDVALKRAEAAHEQMVVKAKAAHQAATVQLVAQRGVLEGELEAFWRVKRKEVEATGARSRRLGYGEMGMRKNPDSLGYAKGVKVEEVIRRIKVHFEGEAAAALLRVKEDLNKDKAFALPEADRLAIGVRHVAGKDTFYVNTFVEALD